MPKASKLPPLTIIALLTLAIGCASTPSTQDQTEMPRQESQAETEPETDVEAAPEPRADSVYEGEGYDADLTNFDYPFPVHFFDFESQRQNLQMAYMDIHPEEPNGKVVVLLHGKNFSGAYWEDTIRGLIDEGYRVVVPDQIGFGKSTKPESFQFTFQTLATYTQKLLDELQIHRATIVGHSMGGMLATRYALMFPEQTAGLVMVNPIGLEDWQKVVPYQPVEAWFAAEMNANRESVKEYMRFAYFDGQWKEDYDELIELQAGWTEGPDKELIAWVAALTFDMVFTQPVLYGFPDITAPTLLIIGQRDRTALGRHLVEPEIAESLGDYPELGRATHRAIPNSQLVELDDIGHVPQFEDFDAYFQALLTFLNDLP